MLAYLHPDPETFCIPIVLFLLIGIPIAALLGKWLTKNDDE